MAANLQPRFVARSLSADERADAVARNARRKTARFWQHGRFLHAHALRSANYERAIALLIVRTRALAAFRRTKNNDRTCLAVGAVVEDADVQRDQSPRRDG